jgi:hypothetical protein
MTKLITISPDTMLALVGGSTLRKMSVPAARDAIIVKSGYDPKTQEFWVEVKADSFDNPAADQRLPQSFILDIQK